MSVQTEAFLALNEERRTAEWAAEKVYRDVLWDYNDAIRKARREYDDKMDGIEKDWQEKLKAIR